MSRSDTIQVGLRLVLLFIADTSFILASRPPHKADTSEIHKDKQALVDYTISRIPLLAGPLIYALTLSQLWFSWSLESRVSGYRLEGWEVVGAVGMILGGQLRLWCYRVLGRFFTFNGHRLITSGPYSIVRHPSYTGILVMSISLAARYTAPNSFLYDFLPSGLISLAFWSSCVGPTYTLVRRIQQEEAMLAQEFGGEWDRYRQKTWRLVPYVW